MTKAEKERAAIDRIMTGLKCSEEEAKEVYAHDMAVERGENTPYDLTGQKAKDAKKFAHTGTRAKSSTVYKFDKKPRKENTTKREIVSQLEQFLIRTFPENMANIQVTNPERLIAFEFNGEKFELTLVQKRK